MVSSQEIILTISIPTYNRSNVLINKLQFINNELNNLGISRNIEILVSDNFSTDDTFERMNGLLSRVFLYKFTYIRRSENIGSSTNFMRSLIEASGKYVWLLSDDDIEPGSIKYLYDVLTDQRNVDFSCVFINYYLNLEKTHSAIPLMCNNKIHDTFEGFALSTMLSYSLISSICFKKSELSEKSMIKHIFSDDGYSNFYPHMFWVFDVVSKGTAFIIYNPLIVARHPGVFESRKRTEARESKEVLKRCDDLHFSAHLDYIKYFSYIKEYLSLGARFKFFRMLNNENINQIIFYKITSKHYSFSSIRNSFKVMVRVFYFSLTFWLLHLPLLLMPSFLSRFVEPYRWRYINARSNLGRLFKFKKNHYILIW
jgi:glycosyltransferase involved in cell wall biosynthesis